MLVEHMLKDGITEKTFVLSFLPLCLANAKDPIATNIKTNIHEILLRINSGPISLWCFSLYLSNLFIGVGFRTVMTFKTHWRNLDSIDVLFVFVFSICVYQQNAIDMTCNKQSYF